jgi:hypothetical protein
VRPRMGSPPPNSKQKRLVDDDHGVHLPGSVSDDTPTAIVM